MVPPPKKPMPEKLRDALNKQRGPYAPEPAALAYAKPEDPHSAERKMLEQILNGCADVPSFDASPRPDPQASNDLVAQMAGRLGKLEASVPGAGRGSRGPNYGSLSLKYDILGTA